jgi:NAD/NADP transhydrogenase alpha subunit
MLLRAVTADGAPAAQALAAMDACCPAGATLLHVAAGTGSVPLLRRLAAWGADSGVAWAVDAPAGQARVTPLHVAAVLPNHAAVLAALTGWCPALRPMSYKPKLSKPLLQGLGLVGLPARPACSILGDVVIPALTCSVQQPRAPPQPG